MKKLWTFALMGAALAAVDTVKYTYDDAGRLIRAGYSSGASITYTYDAAGNLLSREVAAPDGGSASRASNIKAAKRKKEGSSKSAVPQSGAGSHQENP